MKSRTSCFDKTVFRKDMTRFAPIWVLYQICLVMGILLLRADNDAYWFCSDMANLLPVMACINLCYAFLAAQLLFGDLYTSRMCSYIHALPVTRDSLFGSHVAAGILWSLGPTAVAALIAIPLSLGSGIVNGWQIALWWLLGSNLQYLFFFGLAVFCALCTGNRLGQTAVYGIINAIAPIVYWLVDTVYTPLLYGVNTDADPFLQFCPVAKLAGSEYIDLNREWDIRMETIIGGWFELTDGWGYLAICTVLGAALLVCAWMLYRKRQLECAGDFMAVKVIEPVFLTVYSLIVASFFYFVCDEVFYIDGIALIYMAVGLAVGFFTGEMLLQRTTRVFSRKSFGKFALLAVSFGLTIGLTALDPLGLTTWIPEQEEVTAVEVSPYYGYSSYNSVLLEEPQEIADAIRVHEIALEAPQYREPGSFIETSEDGSEIYVNTQTVCLHYHLTNGQVRARTYNVDVGGEVGDLLIPYFNTLEAIFRDYEGDYSLEGILDATQTVSVGCSFYEGEEVKGKIDVDMGTVRISDRAMIREILEALAADAEKGCMAQNWDFRPDPYAESSFHLDFDMGDQWSSVTVYTDCDNLNQWLQDHGFVSYARDTIGQVTVEFETE